MCGRDAHRTLLSLPVFVLMLSSAPAVGLANRHVTGASIDNITASSFDLKLLAISSTFVVSAPPTVVDGEVRMTVEGVVVTKQR